MTKIHTEIETISKAGADVNKARKDQQVYILQHTMVIQQQHNY